MQKRLTDQERIDVVRHYENGLSSCQIAEIYGVTYCAILGLLKRRGIIRRMKRDYRK